MKSVIRLSVLAVAAVGMAVVAPTSGMAQAKKHPAIQIITGPPAPGTPPARRSPNWSTSLTKATRSR